MFKVIVGGLSAVLLAGAAAAAEKPETAPVADWVRPLTYSAASPKGSETAAIAILLNDFQIRLTPNGQSSYHEVVAKAQTAQGLSALGQLSLEWLPETQRLVIHKVKIIRDGKAIDFLATGSGFVTLRRETKLELAMLDGALTAAAQLEGLQVGDILDLAYTIEEADPVLKGKAQDYVFLNLAPVGEAHVRAIWPGDFGVHAWSNDLDQPLTSETHDGMAEVSVTLHDLQPFAAPKAAPLRYQRGRELQFSSFRDWADVASVMAPLFDQAAQIKPGSALDGEIAAIAAATSDPKTRAEMALRLTQDKVRYVFLALNGGGLRPAEVETTWTRRFGDCKAKTALLLAALRRLGVEAEPALVSTTLGDGLDGRPPTLAAFDHVIIRAVIDGRTYWLDGTRTGDRALDEIAPPPYYWALPVRASGSQLARVELQPLRRPQIVVNVNFDASQGLSVPASAHVEAIFRGDLATGLRAQLDNLTPEQLEQGLKQYWKGQYDFIEPKRVAAGFDEKSGEERITLDGEAKLDWSGEGYQIDGATLGWKADLSRNPGPHADAPYAVTFPAFEQRTETIKLPFEGRQFRIVGEAIDETVGGFVFHRSAKLTGDTFSMEASARSVAAEFPAADAAEVAKRVNTLARRPLYLAAPANFVSNKDIAAEINRKPQTAAEYVNHGNALINADRLDEALADLDKAIELDPKDAVAHADRAIVYAWKHDAARAKADIAAALAINPKLAVTYRAKALLAEETGDWQGAVDGYTEALVVEPNDSFSLSHRGSALTNLERYDAALADFNAELAQDADNRLALLHKGMLLARLHRNDEAMSIARRFSSEGASDPARLQGAAQIYLEMDSRDEARALLDKAIAIKPDAGLYFDRARTRDKDDVPSITADCEAALKLVPAYEPCIGRLINLYAGRKDHEGAVRWLSYGVQHKPDWYELRTARGRQYLLLGRKAEAEADFAAVRAIASANAGLLNNLCWESAIAGGDLVQALADCDAALKLAPDNGPILDSRGFVLLRLGRYEEAVASYDAALKARPGQAESLFGRSLAERKLGRTDDAERDRAAAVAKFAGVTGEFMDYGVEVG